MNTTDAPRKPVVLVVDDEAPIRGLLEMSLSSLGFAVLAAGSGEEAVDLYRRHGGEVDLVLCDVQMPGLDGPGTLDALRALDPHARCCFMSGDLGRYTAWELLARGACCVLPKPLDLAGLARTLREALADTRG